MVAYSFDGHDGLMNMEVWAPNAGSVELVLDGTSHPMSPSERGRWAVEVAAQPGMRYGYRLDESDPLPDPRSNSQPDGVHELSELIDHRTFRWTDQAWTPGAFEGWIIYELHVGTFTPEGTFDSAIEKLDHLVDLGITAVELMPVNSFSGKRGWGYDGTSLFAPHASYGGPDALKRFVDACHARGLATILDVVYNHLGPSGNYLPRYGPYFTDQYKTPWGDAVNFDDAGSNEVRRFVIDNAMHWILHYHFDGLRIDAVHAVLDRSPVHIFEQMSEEVDLLVEKIGRPVFLIAESDLGDPRVFQPRTSGGWGLDAQWSDDFHHALHSCLTGETDGYYADFGSIEQLAVALHQAWVYDGCYSAFRDRNHGRSHQGASAHRFLGYIQNHDQIGNRAAGERIAHLTGDGLAKVAATLVLTAPFVPMLFMGEEWAASSPFQYFTAHEDPKLGKAVSEGRRHEFAAFGWDPADVPDPQDPATFQRSKLNWDELQDTPHAEMLELHKELIALRRSNPDLTDGSLEKVTVEYDEDERWLVLHRGGLSVACNLSTASASLPLTGELLLATEEGSTQQGDGTLILGPTSAAILRSGQ